jgi:hypothetical protein
VLSRQDEGREDEVVVFPEFPAGQVLSASGVPVEEIDRLAGYSSSRIMEVVCRKELRPVLIKALR